MCAGGGCVCMCVVCVSVKRELTAVTLVGVMLLLNITRYTKKQTSFKKRNIPVALERNGENMERVRIELEGSDFIHCFFINYCPRIIRSSRSL